jgi:hypothetical protein
MKAVPTVLALALSLSAALAQTTPAPQPVAMSAEMQAVVAELNKTIGAASEACQAAVVTAVKGKAVACARWSKDTPVLATLQKTIDAYLLKAEGKAAKSGWQANKYPNAKTGPQYEGQRLAFTIGKVAYSLSMRAETTAGKNRPGTVLVIASTTK